MKKFTKSSILLYAIVFIVSTVLGTWLNPFSDTRYVYSEEENIVSYALSWVGNTNIPYVWGGGRNQGDTLESLAQDLNTGTDCSGFVSLVYAHFGISIPAQSDSIHNSALGRKFYSIDDARPGDVCWWDGHVALYIGGGKIVHTNTSDTTNGANLIHVSIIDGDGANYRFPSEFIRFLSDEDLDNGDTFGDTTDASTTYEVTNAVATGNLVTESDLTGMKTQWSVEEYQKTISLMSRDDLPLGDQIGLVSVGEGIKHSKLTVSSVVNALVTGIGYVLMLYGLAIILAYFFDKTNAFIDISLLQLISFGHWYLIESEEDKPSFVEGRGKKTFITKTGIILRAVIIEVIAVLLISGKFTLFLMWLWGRVF